MDEIHEVSAPYTELISNYYGTEFPLWYETAAAVMLEPSIVKNSTKFYLDVDTSYASPGYGNIHAYQKALAPTAQSLQKVNFVIEIDGDALKQRVKEAVQASLSC